MREWTLLIWLVVFFFFFVEEIWLVVCRTWRVVKSHVAILILHSAKLTVVMLISFSLMVFYQFVLTFLFF